MMTVAFGCTVGPLVHGEQMPRVLFKRIHANGTGWNLLLTPALENMLLYRIKRTFFNIINHAINRGKTVRRHH